MSPNFLPDSFVFAIKHPWQRLSVGDVILVNHDVYGKMIKRIDKIQRDNTHNESQKIMLKSDNLVGVTTEQMGAIGFNQVIGKVIWQVKPPTEP